MMKIFYMHLYSVRERVAAQLLLETIYVYNNNIIMKINRKMSFFFRHVGRPVIINKYLDPQ
jgi:hypothetical protein